MRLTHLSAESVCGGHVPSGNSSIPVRSVAFPASEYNEVLSGYRSGQVLERWENKRFVDHLCRRPQGTDMDIFGTNHQKAKGGVLRRALGIVPC
jgi:hypothetical protein